MNTPNPNNAMLDLLPFNIPIAPVIPNLDAVIDMYMIPDEDEKMNDADIIPAEEVISVEMILDEELIYVDMTLNEGDVGGLDLEELFGLGLDDDDIMPNPVGPNINAQRQNTVRVSNRHRVYNIMNEGDLMSEDEE
uniref:Uncharacterized protein n=1 Tax=Tanacetum cinerariifolium TaxID=118510 RepID=A0A6L2LT04_TANCI|nr:hypothetical protein [Tanacetum cinerariifolium]